jgi:putative ABC transport system permease protein
MIAGLALFPHVSWPYLRRRKGRAAMALLSLALAVALFAAIRITDYSTVRAFEQSTNALLGSVQFVLTHGSGVETEALTLAEQTPGVRAAPVIQRAANAGELGITLTVLGIDYARDARVRSYRPIGEFNWSRLVLDRQVVVIPQSLGARYGLKLGDALVLSADGGEFRYSIAGLLRDEGPAAAVGGRVAVMPLSAAQELFAIPERVDRIDLVFDTQGAGDALRAGLPAGYTLEPAPRSSPVLDYSLAQMRTISLGVTLVALTIGLFIVYNSVSLSVTERAGELATVRALGARRRDVLSIFLVEAVVLGVPASVLGIGLGVLAARQMLRQAATNMNVMVQTVDITSMHIPPDAWTLGPLLGVVTALAGTFSAARAAARVSPAAAGSRSGAALLTVQASRLWRWLLAAVPLGAVSLALVLHPATPRMIAIVGFALVVLSLGLALPQVILWMTLPLRALARRWLGIESYLAFDNVAKYAARTALTVVALAGSLAIVVAVSGMLRGFERATTRWMDDVFAFDLSVQANPLTATAYSGTAFPEDLMAEVAADPRVADASGARVVFQPYAGRTVMLLAIDAEPFWRMLVRRQRISPDDARALVSELKRGAILVSRNFAHLYGVREGDRVRLAAAGGTRDLVVARVTEDYSWPLGVIGMDREVYKTGWHDRSITYLDVQVRDPHDIDALQADLTRSLRGQRTLYVHKLSDIKTYGTALLRDWFRLADAQIGLALMIGAVGVANTLLISVLGQSRQIGLIRAVGATRRQIQRVLVTEALLLGASGGLLGVVMGILVAAGLAPVFILRESGYRFPFVTPWSSIALAAIGGLVIALLASLLPIRAVRRFDIVRAIGME